MKDLKETTEMELLYKAKEYEKRMLDLEKDISDFMNGNIQKESIIKNEYKKLKNEIREESKYLDKRRNSMLHISDIHNAYQHGIMECAAFGFRERVNSKIDQKLFNSVEEAEYRFTKYLIALDEYR